MPGFSFDGVADGDTVTAQSYLPNGGAASPNQNESKKRDVTGVELATNLLASLGRVMLEDSNALNVRKASSGCNRNAGVSLTTIREPQKISRNSFGHWVDLLIQRRMVKLPSAILLQVISTITRLFAKYWYLR
jgi:hypothetical protein